MSDYDETKLHEINVLVIGESGVGKSTFINALSNYLKYNSLEEAEKNKLICKIPISFTITDDNYQPIQVKAGAADENENHNTGKAGTQGAKKHSILYDNDTKVLNIIDSAGIGDPDGFQKDQENCTNLVKYISNTPQLHAICILLKPNKARLDVSFRYCLNELLTHLDKQASYNIVFCFTCSRNTSFKPGDSYPVLLNFLDGIKYNGTIDKSNIFFFDSESFRYLAAKACGIRFSDEEKQQYTESWNKSFENAQRLICYISKLEPYNTVRMSNLYKSRTILLNLSKVVVETIHVIQTNIKLAEDKIKEIERLKNTNETILKEQLQYTQVDLKTSTLACARTVCTDPQCAKIVQINGLTKIDYISICHDNCKCVSVDPNTVNSVSLLKCIAMSGADICIKCKHHYTKHIHVTHESKPTTVTITDDNVERMIKDNRRKKEICDAVLEKVNKVVNGYLDEQEKILKVCVKCAQFSKENAIVAFNDALIDYLDIVIRDEEGKVSSGLTNNKILNALRDIKDQYLALKLHFDDNISNEISKIGDVESLIERLFNLRNTGRQIRALLAS